MCSFIAFAYIEEACFSHWLQTKSWTFKIILAFARYELHAFVIEVLFIQYSPNFSPELNQFPERISIRVIDPFTIKPLDVKTIMDHTRATRGRILTVEDHYYEGGSPYKH